MMNLFLTSPALSLAVISLKSRIQANIKEETGTQRKQSGEADPTRNDGRRLWVLPTKEERGCSVAREAPHVTDRL